MGLEVGCTSKKALRVPEGFCSLHLKQSGWPQVGGERRWMADVWGRIWSSVLGMLSLRYQTDG